MPDQLHDTARGLPVPKGIVRPRHGLVSHGDLGGILGQRRKAAAARLGPLRSLGIGLHSVLDAPHDTLLLDRLLRVLPAGLKALLKRMEEKGLLARRGGAEGGDDIMVAGPGIERNEGMLGFDWVSFEEHTSFGADADMRVKIFTNTSWMRSRSSSPWGRWARTSRLTKGCRCSTRSLADWAVTPTPTCCPG